MNLTDVKSQIEKIRKEIKGKGVQAYRDYLLEEHEFSEEHDEMFFENKYNVRFCNGLQHPIKKAQLVYCAYDGILSIAPVGNHDSYFNIEGMDPIEIPEEDWINTVYELWGKLTDQ